MTINTSAHTATITLKQRGFNGPIDFDLGHTTDPAEHYYEGYMLAGMLAAKWFEVRGLLKTNEAENPEDTLYTATFAIGQQGEGSDLFFKLEMEPKLEHTATVFPEAFQAISHLATVALYEVGVLDEDGNVTDEDGLDNLDIHATSRNTQTLH